jgi:hypothetical protein
MEFRNPESASWRDGFTRRFVTAYDCETVNGLRHALWMPTRIKPCGEWCKKEAKEYTDKQNRKQLEV